MFTEKLSHLSWGWGCFAGRGSSGPCTTCRCARSSRCPAGAAKLPPARRSHTRCARPVGGPCPLWLEGQNTHTGQTQWRLECDGWTSFTCFVVILILEASCDACLKITRRKCCGAGTTTHNRASGTDMSPITLSDITIITNAACRLEQNYYHFQLMYFIS